MTAPAPLIKRRVDLSGVWQAEPAPVSEFPRLLGADLVKVQVDLSDITKHVINMSGASNPKMSRFGPRGHRS